MYFGNQSLLANSAKPLSLLKKEYFYIAYQFVREVLKNYEWINGYIYTHGKESYFFTKILMVNKRNIYANDITSHNMITA